MSKTCSKCDEEKPLDCFMKRKDSLDGYRNMCKPCMPKYKQLPPTDNGPKTCSKCQIEKLFAEFYLTNDNICKICHLIRKTNNNHTLSGALKVLLINSKKNNVDNESSDEDINEITEAMNSLEFNLTFDDINEVYEIQTGLCYYSKMKMSFDGEYQMSLSRLSNDLGYIKSNIILCCLEFSSSQIKWSVDKVKEMVEILDNNIEDNYVDFDKMSNSSNKKDYYDSARCKMKSLITSAKSRAIKKKMSFELDYEFIVELYDKQKGLCAYSSIPLKFGDTNWLISLKRINITKGYLKYNVCLICIEFSTTDRSTNKKIKSDTSSAWSKEKFKIIIKKIRENLA